MNAPDPDEDMLRRLQSCRLAEPSPDLRERVLAAASRALPERGAADEEVAWTAALRPVWFAAAALVVLVVGTAALQARLPPPVDFGPLFESGTPAPASRDRQRQVVALILLHGDALGRHDPAGDSRPWPRASDAQEPALQPTLPGTVPNPGGACR